MKTILAALLVSAAAIAPAHAALKEGATAPDFTAKAALAGRDFDFSLANALKKGPVVLFFFPAAFTTGCTIESHLFAEATDDFKKAGATVIGITAGNIDRVNEFSATECRNKFAVAADPGGKIAQTYDSVSATRPEWSNRTSYVITPDGKIIYAYSDRKPEGHVENTMSAVKAWEAAKVKGRKRS